MTQTRRKKLGSIALMMVVVASSLALFASPAAAAGDVTITIEDGDSNAIEDATVTLYNASDDTEVANGTTGSSGEATLSSVSDGTYYAEATAENYTTEQSSNITVSGSAVSETVALTADGVLVDSMDVEIDASSSDVWAEVDNSTLDNSTTEVDVVFIGLNESSDSHETELDRQSLAADGVQTVEMALTDSDRETYESIRVEVRGVDGTEIDSLDAGTYQKVAGGGGGSGDGLLGGSIMGIPMILIVAAGGLLLYTQKD